MKIKKIIFSVIGVIVLLIVVLIVGVLLFLDSIVTKAVTSIGTDATATRVQLVSTSISLFGGSLELKGLKIANPKGYQKPEAFGFDRFFVDVDLGTVTSDKIVIDKVEIKGVHINYEPKTDGGSNLNDIKDNIMKYIGVEKQAEKAAEETKSTPEEKVEKPAPAGEPKPGKKIVIKRLLITNAKVSVSSSLLGQSMTLPLADIEITGIGESSDVSYGEAMAEVYQALMEGIAKAVSGAGLDNINVSGLTGGVTDTVNKVGKDIKKSLDKFKNSIFN